MKIRLLTAAILLATLLAAAGVAYGRAAQPLAAASDEFRSSPVMFIENAGQWPDGARFQVRGGSDGTLWLAGDGLWLTLREPAPDTGRAEPDAAPPDTTRGVNIRLRFAGANPNARIEPFDRLDTAISYFIGNDPDLWRPDVPVWGGVRYVELYPGIDLVASQANGRLALRLDARPGADLDKVALRVDGAGGVTTGDGFLRLQTPYGTASLPLPTTGRPAAGTASVRPRGEQAFEVTAPFALADAPAQPRAADNNPGALLYSTFLGGGAPDYGYGVAADASGNAYVTGYMESNDFPTTPGAFDTTYNGGTDVFIAKLNPTGSALVYATVVGGASIDDGYAIAVDSGNNAYVTGITRSPAPPTFPTTPGAYDTTFNGGNYDAFVLKLNPAGTGLVYSTYLGGNGDEWGYGIAVDATGNAYVTGGTFSANFPATTGAFDTSHNGNEDAFVARLNPTGSALVYSTFLGGNDVDYAKTIALDAAGNAYAIGTTFSANFPTTSGAFRPGPLSGLSDVFVVKLGPAGNSLAYSTFLGGSNRDYGLGIAVDGAGSAYATGYTYSTNFPTTAGAYITSHRGGSIDAFVTKLKPDGSGPVYSTYLGGSDVDYGYAIAVDAAGGAYVTGDTKSSNFPTTPDKIHGRARDYDAYVLRLNPAGDGLVYATFLGGAVTGDTIDKKADDRGQGIALAGGSAVYVTGLTKSIDFPTTTGAFSTTYNGGRSDVFVAKVATAPVCYKLTLGHTGNGDDPAANPAQSANCPAGQYVAGESISLTAAPASGWRVKSWSGTTNNSSTATTNSATMPAAAHTVSVTYEQIPVCYALTLSHSGQGSNPAANPTNSTGCPANQYLAGETISLTAVPAPGWRVKSWSGTANDSSTATTNSVTMPAAARTVSVIYEVIPPTCYKLTLSHTGSGGDPTPGLTNSTGCPAGEYIAGESIGLTAAPAPGWRVKSWAGTGNDGSTANSNTVTMPAKAHAASVNYEVIPPTCYLLALSHSGQGSDPTAAPANSTGCGAGQYVAGETISLTAVPAPGWRVKNWSGTTNDSSQATTNSVTMPAKAHAASVAYEQLPPTCYKLTLGHTGQGGDPTASPANSTGCGAGQYTAGQSISLTASPASGWRVKNWSGTINDGSQATTNNVTMPAAAHTASVAYEQLPPTCYKLTLGHTGQGGDPVASPANSTGCGAGEYTAGQSISLTASPAQGWRVKSWSGTTNDSSMAMTNSVTMPAAAHTAAVAYEVTPPVCHALTLSHTGQGGDPAANPAKSAGCPTGQYIAGDPIALTASPATGWRVKNWSGTDNDSSMATANVLTMPAAAHEVSVVYEPGPPTCYKLTLGHTGQGSDPVASPTSSAGCASGQYTAGQPIALTAAPAPGWRVKNWSGTTNNSSIGLRNGVTMPAADHAAGVNYEVIGPTEHKVFMGAVFK
ncbi:MAG: SBBP repeat-containing protein [Anaerolineae bacterium]|nr:SBBP repeat-containing protein [Anaerolineae bacterium]